LWIIAFAGEEQGLDGSRAHVKKLRDAGTLSAVRAMINMDMIGYRKQQTAVILESEEHAAELVDLMADAALRYTELDVEKAFDAWGSDHVPYLDAQIPAVLTIDRDWSSYPAYHRRTDLPEKVDPVIAGEIMKMNLASLHTLLEPVSRRGSVDRQDQ
jgi:Zn-dependent M28 family amino/carboxypeptidase